MMNARLFARPQPKAFSPCQTKEIEEKRVEEALTGLYQLNPVHDFEEKEYSVQMDKLIDQMCQFIPEKFIFSNNEIAPAIEGMKVTLRDRSYAAGDENATKRYFKIYKKNLEAIYYLISEWEEDKRYKFVLDLGKKILVCAAGAFTQLEQSLYELTVKQDTDSWLAELRKNILHDWAESHIAEHEIHEQMSIHVHTQCLKIAVKNGWYIPGTDNIAGLQDQYEDGVKLSEQSISDMERFFAEQYSREAIIKNIVFNVNSCLTPFKGQIIQYHINHDVLKIFEMFGFNTLQYLVLDDDDGITFRIRDRFWDELSSQVEQFLEQNDYIKRKKDYFPQKYFVEQNILPLIRQERDRLEEKYGKKSHRRLDILNGLIDTIRSSIIQDSSDDSGVVSRTAALVNKALVDYPQLDVRQGWAKKFGLILLNILMAAPIFIPCAVKYATTGSCFFSLRGKTCDMLNNTVSRLESFRVPTIAQ